MQKNAKENAKNIQYFATIWRGLLFSLIQNSFHSFGGAFTDDGTEHNQKTKLRQLLSPSKHLYFVTADTV